MAVKLSGYSPALRDEIDALNSSLGGRLPNEYIEFLLSYNGAKPATNIFSVNEGNECGVDEFIPCKTVIKELPRIDHVSKDMLPIAWAEGGNYILLSLVSGKIYFWDHEVPEEPTELATGITEFLDLLKPFDASSVELKEGQVESAWIDPDFLKNL